MRRLLLLSLALSFLTACSLTGSAGVSDSSEPSLDSTLPETHNVSYTGIVRASEGENGGYVLALADGRFVLIESNLLSLADYVAKEVVLFGSVRPTSEDGGVLMRVESVTILTAESSSSLSSDEASSDLSSESSEASSFSSLSSLAASSAPSSRLAVLSSVAPVQPSSAASSVGSKTSVAPAASSVAGVSAALDARVKAMAKEDLAAGRWTQQYCTSHIGFCVAVHKNWWFTSFGTAASALWHLEVSNAEIAGMGDGPIVVNLMKGTVEGAGASDGAVVEKNGFVVAYRAWKDSTHFEISAPAALRAAVTYMSQSLTAYSVSQ